MVAAGEVAVEAMAAADTTTWVEVEELPHLGRVCMMMYHNLMPTRDHLDVVEASAREAPLILNTHRRPTPQQAQRMLENLAQTTVVVDVVEAEVSTLTLDERIGQGYLHPLRMIPSLTFLTARRCKMGNSRDRSNCNPLRLGLFAVILFFFRNDGTCINTTY
jgi:hypothetical protein